VSGKDHHHAIIVVFGVRLALPCSFSASQLIAYVSFRFSSSLPSKLFHVRSLFIKECHFCMFFHVASALSCWQHTLILGVCLYIYYFKIYRRIKLINK
jgi:hypothetical protein